MASRRASGPGGPRKKRPSDSRAISRGASAQRSRKSLRIVTTRRTGAPASSARPRSAAMKARRSASSVTKVYSSSSWSTRQSRLTPSFRARALSTTPAKPGSTASRRASFELSPTVSSSVTAEVSSGPTTAASAPRGSRPGRSVIASHGSPECSSAGTSPARTKDDLPTPEGPTTATIGQSRTRLTAVAISEERPKKKAACSSWNEVRPT